MSRSRLVLIPLLVLVMNVQAREQSAARSESSSRSESASHAPSPHQSPSQSQTQTQELSAHGRYAQDADALQAEQLNRQRRRDILREALRLQQEESPATSRQMSLQERTELRQQLRQQQEWLK